MAKNELKKTQRAFTEIKTVFKTAVALEILRSVPIS